MATKTKAWILTALFAALSAIGAFIRIPVGPAPITLQFLFVALAGILLGPYWGALSQIVYVALGLLGLPIFTAGGGPQYVFNSTFGYLLGFIAGAFVIGAVTRHMRASSFVRILAGCLLGLAVIYGIGVPYLYWIMRTVSHTPISFAQAWIVGCAVFLPGDFVKTLLAAWLSKKMVPILRQNHLV